MDDFNLKNFLIPKVNAQDLDALAQPTFGPLDIGAGNSVNASVLLSSDKTAVEDTETFTVTVELQTNDVNISEYRLVIDFDPTKVSVVEDSDPVTQGTQITVLDDVFQVESPEEDNSVSSVGRILLQLSAPDQALTVNRNVAQITFQAQSTGTANISIVEGTVGTQIIRQAGVGLPFSSNEISVEISDEPIDQNQDTTTNTTGDNNTTTTGTPSPTTTTTTGTQPPKVIPDTAITDDFGSLIILLISVVSIVLGASLFFGNKDEYDGVY